MEQILKHRKPGRMVRLLGDVQNNGKTNLTRALQKLQRRQGGTGFFFLYDNLALEAGSLMSSSVLRRREVYMQTRQKNKFPVSPLEHASLSGSWL